MKALAKIITLIGVLTMITCTGIKKKYDILAKQLVSNKKQISQVITEADIKDLPAPVQRYLRYTGVIGKKIPHNVVLHQKGKLRLSPEHKWLDFTAAQTYNIDTSSFAWYGNVKMNPLIRIKALDSLADGKGRMHIKIEPFITIADATGDEMNTSTLLRYLDEIIWFPAAFVSDAITWKAVDDTRARATLTYQDKQVSGDFIFDDEGKIVNFITQRYMGTGKTMALRKWKTPMFNYQEVNGVMIPMSGSAVWTMDDGSDFKSIMIELVDVTYDS